MGLFTNISSEVRSLCRFVSGQGTEQIGQDVWTVAREVDKAREKKRSLAGEKAGVQNLFGGILSGKTNITMENHHFYIIE